MADPILTAAGFEAEVRREALRWATERGVLAP